MIKTFECIKDADLNLVGSKGLKLAQMYQAGMNVPDGFVITTELYDSYTEHGGLTNEIQGILDSDLSLEETSKTIKNLFKSSGLDEKVKSDLVHEMKRLGYAQVAVRSSSTMEDLEGMSFAGQYSSFLNVTEEALVDKIIECWQSLWNERAIEYRKKNRLMDLPKHAVIVQGMVPAISAGVLFTANPVSGLREEMVINHAPGLGEGIVSGDVDPDQLSIHKITGEVHYSHKVHDILSDEACQTLRKLGEKVENHYGKPQDIEYAFDKKGVLYLLQTRDITTLFPIDGMVQDDKIRTYLNVGTVMLGMKEPFTPMGFDIMSYMFPTIINVMTARKKNPLTNSFVKHVGGRMFADISYLMASKMVSKQFANAFSGNDLPLKGVMHAVIDNYGKQLRKQGIKFRIPFGMLGYSIAMVMDMGKVNKIPSEERYDALKALGEKAYQEQRAVYDNLNTIAQKLNFAKEALVVAFKLSQTQALYCIDAGNFPKVEKSIKKYFDDKYRAETLVQSLPGCISQSLMLDLNHYAKWLDEQNKEVSVDDPMFAAIIEKYGHRANIELDIGTKRWSEDPSYLIERVKSYQHDKQYQRNLEEHVEKGIEAVDMINNIYSELKAMKGERTASKLKTLMEKYRIAIAMREYPKYDIVHIAGLGRKAIKDVGNTLVALNLIDEANDVFYLYIEDIMAVVDVSTNDIDVKKAAVLREKVETNKDLYAQEMERTTVPRVVMNNGDTYYTSTVIDKDAKILNGLPLSPGVYEGVIRVVFEPRTTELKKGEIMVTESTNPAWTPLFATAGALIMEYGGPMSHGGIVAREYGIPAVVGIPSATNALRDGQRVRVNGETGVIELLD